ncbi:MAG: MgtC/SapB family protein [Clostridia bacterium]|nr:MgtC/SapB family protein [Clostridia bacterium]
MEWLDSLRGASLAALVIKLVLAVILGGSIGLERGRKRRPAGFRTHILVCMGATLAMCISRYCIETLGITVDVSRLGAQVINGIGFLGAGTIIVTRRQEVKGLTTAAGLWACACMGLAVGAGFFECAIIAFAAIILSTTLLDKIEKMITSRSRNMNINVMVTETAIIASVHEVLRSMNIRIYDSEITNVRELANESPNVVIETQLSRRRPHVEIIAALAAIDGVISVEEL